LKRIFATVAIKSSIKFGGLLTKEDVQNAETACWLNASVVLFLMMTCVPMVMMIVVQFAIMKSVMSYW